MSSLSDHSETGSFSGKKMMRLADKPNFSQTCSLLSQYLKERGSFGDLMNMGVTCNPEAKGKPETCSAQTVTTRNLLPNLEMSSEASSEEMVTANRKIQSMDLFPQHTGFAHGSSSSIPAEDDQKAANVKGSSQMTIFYAGKVLVFDDFPAEKAKEIMLLASNGSSQKPTTAFTSTSGTDQPNQTTSNLVPTPATATNQEQPQLPPRPIVSDLPIARKASLHRFLEKRKDRISAKAPYPPANANNPAVTSSKQGESKKWLGLASDAAAAGGTKNQLELQL